MFCLCRLECEMSDGAVGRKAIELPFQPWDGLVIFGETAERAGVKVVSVAYDTKQWGRFILDVVPRKAVSDRAGYFGEGWAWDRTEDSSS